MHDSGVMRLREPFRHLGEVAEEHRQRLPGVMDLFAERHAVDVLHRDEGRALAVADLVDVRDVGMIERGGGFGLSDETLHAITIRRDVGRQDLQRHFPIELRILGQIHLAHPAGAEQRGDPVVFERAVDHEGVGSRRFPPLNGSSTAQAATTLMRTARREGALFLITISTS